MNAFPFLPERRTSPRRNIVWPRLASAELLKLRRRRGLVVASLLFTLGPIFVAYTVLLLMHASDPGTHGPAGGVVNFAHTIQVLARVGVVAAFLVGVAAGTGDIRAGVFRELVVTGRPRIALFAARIPGGLAFVTALFALSFAITAAASVALAGSLETPSAMVLVKAGAWVLIAAVANFALALGIASLVRSASISIAVLLAWNFAVIPALRVMDALGSVRDWLLPIALERMQPTELSPATETSLAVSVAAVAVWSLVPLVLGGWRTARGDV